MIYDICSGNYMIEEFICMAKKYILYVHDVLSIFKQLIYYAVGQDKTRTYGSSIHLYWSWYLKSTIKVRKKKAFHLQGCTLQHWQYCTFDCLEKSYIRVIQQTVCDVVGAKLKLSFDLDRQKCRIKRNIHVFFYLGVYYLVLIIVWKKQCWG